MINYPDHMLALRIILVYRRFRTIIYDGAAKTSKRPQTRELACPVQPPRAAPKCLDNNLNSSSLQSKKSSKKS